MLRHSAKLLVITIVFAACKQQNDTAQIAMIIQGLQNANGVIQEYNFRFHMDFENKSADPMFLSWNRKWNPKTKKIKNLSAQMSLYIDSCINTLKAGTKTEISPHSIYLKLFNYKRDLVNVFDPEEYHDSPVFREHIIKHKHYFFTEIPVLASIDDTSSAAINDLNEKRWIDSSFSKGDIEMNTLVLYKLKNDILISEQTLLNFCFRSVTDHTPHYEGLQVITSLSSSNIKIGETVEVTAGIAIVNDRLNPRVTIDGKKVGLTGMGLTEYTFQPKGKPGKYTLPVIVEVTKPDGTIERYEKKLNYTIVP